MKQPVMESDLTDFAAEDAIKMMAPNVEVTGAVYNGATWTTAPLSDNTVANLNPRTAISADGSSAVALWSSGQIVIEDNGAQYVNGDLLFSRFDGSGWSTPIPVMGLDKNLILSDYSVALGNGGETLVLASRSAAEQAEIDELMFISVIPGTPDTVNIFSGGLRGTDAQITRVGDSFVASYVTATSGSRQDLYLATVDSLGRPAGKVGGFAGLANHTMYNVRVVADDDAQDLGGLAVLWNEARAVEVSGDSIAYQTGLYAAKLAKWDNSLYASYPVRLLTVPEGYRPAAYDAHLSGLNLKAAATLANETGGAGVMEGSVSFANSLACTGQDFDALNALPGDGIPVSLTLQNTGFEPVTSVTVTMGSSTKTTALDLLPGSSATVTGIYTVPDNFDGTIAYDISASFADPDMTLRSARLRASQPVTLSGSVNASTVDMYVEILSNTSGETHNNIVLKVGNHSGMPLANRGISTIYAGLYKDPQSREPYAGVSPTGIPATDLYDAGKGNMNRVVSFQLPAVTEGVVVWALVETKDNQGNVVTDTRTIDNFIPVQLYPEANAVASPAPAITTASLPNGQVGQPYSAQLAATGFSAITWGIASGPGLPGGLHLRDTTGIISGVPTTAGVFTFSVTATSDIAADTATLSIRIIQPDVEDADVEDVEDVEEPDEGEPTGIEDAEENPLAAQATDGGLLVSGLIPGEALSLYNLQGQLLFRQPQATTPQLLVPLAGKGVYIIAAGKRRLKAIY